jgi:hypothetical protein
MTETEAESIARPLPANGRKAESKSEVCAGRVAANKVVDQDKPEATNQEHPGAPTLLGEIPPPQKRLLDETEAAIYLRKQMGRCSARTLRRWRSPKVRIGPPFHHGGPGGKVWYSRADLDEWLEISTVVDPLEEAA